MQTHKLSVPPLLLDFALGWFLRNRNLTYDIAAWASQVRLLGTVLETLVGNLRARKDGIVETRLKLPSLAVSR